MNKEEFVIEYPWVLVCNSYTVKCECPSTPYFEYKLDEDGEPIEPIGQYSYINKQELKNCKCGAKQRLLNWMMRDYKTILKVSSKDYLQSENEKWKDCPTDHSNYRYKFCLEDFD